MRGDVETIIDREFARPGRLSPLWYSILIGPVIWAVDFAISYALVPHACSTGHDFLLHLSGILSVIIALSGAAVALRSLAEIPTGASMQGGAARDRARFMAMAGLVLSVTFALLIIAQEIPRFMLHPCDQ
jgi:hypothetical protein